MYCPACGTENSGEDRRFCCTCDTDLRVVSHALSKSLPVKIGSTLDVYLQNRSQRNFKSGVLNLIAFITLLLAGAYNFSWGFTFVGSFLFGLGILSLVLGIWDVWIYRHNLPSVAKPKQLERTPTTKELTAPHTDLTPPVGVTEPTTQKPVAKIVHCGEHSSPNQNKEEATREGGLKFF